ncbi:hypothetical protein ACFVS2_26955 [Brevibacillus sp. NPDC058079]|uniref:hypothetical protein n=1 Tax=Brevibacillus sp. NPDC058079 TaxID=3346330 RepID=UPI0036F0A2C2
MDTLQDKKYQIWGYEWSYNDLKSFKTLKTYLSTNQDTVSLVQSPNGLMFLYNFHEEMGFPHDSINEHFFLVNSESQADEFATYGLLTLKSVFSHWIHVPPNYNIQVKGKQESITSTGDRTDLNGLINKKIEELKNEIAPTYCGELEYQRWQYARDVKIEVLQELLGELK